MLSSQSQALEKSRLGVLLGHFAAIDDPRDIRRTAHPLAEILLLVVCGSMADCDDYDHIAAWGEADLDFLRRHLAYTHGVPGGRWLTILMNRLNPALFSAAFTAWVRATWPDRPDFIAIAGKTSRRSHQGRRGRPPAGRQGQPTDAARRDRGLLRASAARRRPDPCRARQRPRPH